MSNLVAISFEEKKTAFEVRDKLRSLQREYLISMEDAVVVTKNAKGKIKLHQSYNLTAMGAAGGGFWGALLGVIFMNPLAGAAVGASAGALSGACSDIGISNDFMKRCAESLKNDSSALFLLIHKGNFNKVLPELEKFEGTLIQTSLSDEADEKLRNALGEKASA